MGQNVILLLPKCTSHFGPQFVRHIRNHETVPRTPWLSQTMMFANPCKEYKRELDMGIEILEFLQPETLQNMINQGRTKL